MSTEAISEEHSARLILSGEPRGQNQQSEPNVINIGSGEDGPEATDGAVGHNDPRRNNNEETGFISAPHWDGHPGPGVTYAMQQPLLIYTPPPSPAPFLWVEDEHLRSKATATMAALSGVEDSLKKILRGDVWSNRATKTKPEIPPARDA